MRLVVFHSSHPWQRDRIVANITALLNQHPVNYEPIANSIIWVNPNQKESRAIAHMTTSRSGITISIVDTPSGDQITFMLEHWRDHAD